MTGFIFRVSALSEAPSLFFLSFFAHGENTTALIPCYSIPGMECQTMTPHDYLHLPCCKRHYAGNKP
jgi:hypothetical protein